MPNAYQRREAERLAKKHEAQRIAREETLHEAEHLCLEYQKIYQQLYGRKPSVSYIGGWYNAGSRKYRKQAFKKFIDRLYAIQHEQELGGNND